MNAKSNAINQGIDHEAYEEIDMPKLLSYKGFNNQDAERSTTPPKGLELDNSSSS